MNPNRLTSQAAARRAYAKSPSSQQVLVKVLDRMRDLCDRREKGPTLELIRKMMGMIDSENAPDDIRESLRSVIRLYEAAFVEVCLGNWQRASEIIEGIKNFYPDPATA